MFTLSTYDADKRSGTIPHPSPNMARPGFESREPGAIPRRDERVTVIERGDNWLLRNFTLRGEDMQERVTFEPEERVTFVRTKSSAMGTVMNEIVETNDCEIGLRFTFSLDVEGLEDGSVEEAEFADRMSKSYFQGVESTLAELRRRVTAGELNAA